MTASGKSNNRSRAPISEGFNFFDSVYAYETQDLLNTRKFTIRTLSEWLLLPENLAHINFLSLSFSFSLPLSPGQVPQFGYSDEVDMTELVHLRSLIRDHLLEQGIRFSYMPVIIKALSMALHHYPILNAVVDADCTTMTEKADHNIGVAMDTAEGLVVPNVKQVQVGLRTN